MALIDDPAAAERLAKAILDDITLEHDEEVRKARHLDEELVQWIDEGRVLFRARVAPQLHTIYDDEIMPWTGRAKTRANNLAPAKLDGTRVIMLVAGVAALAVVIVWLLVR